MPNAYTELWPFELVNFDSGHPVWYKRPVWNVHLKIEDPVL